MSEITPSEPNPSRRRLERMIRATGLKPADRVIIAGHENFELMLGLCRKGFRAASCKAARGGPNDGGPPADLLWIPNAGSDVQLGDTVMRLGRGLRPGGRIIFDQETAKQARSLAGRLADRGYVVDYEHGDAMNSRRFLFLRKRSDVAAPRRAA